MVLESILRCSDFRICILKCVIIYVYNTACRRQGGSVYLNNNFEYILFDLDGTITDSGEGITKSVQYALKYFDILVNNLR